MSFDSISRSLGAYEVGVRCDRYERSSDTGICREERLRHLKICPTLGQKIMTSEARARLLPSIQEVRPIQRKSHHNGVQWCYVNIEASPPQCHPSGASRQAGGIDRQSSSVERQSCL